PPLYTSANVADSTSSIVEFTTAAQEHTSVINVISKPTPRYSLGIFEGTNPSDLILDLGQEARASANTTDPSVSQVNFTWNNPSGDPVATELVPLSLTGQAESRFTPDEVGKWTVYADFGNGEVRRQTFDVRMFLIPESPVGTLALIASSMAALA